MMNRTKKERAERKVQVAIDKLIELKEDFDLGEEDCCAVDRVLDSLNELEYRISNLPVTSRSR